MKRIRRTVAICLSILSIFGCGSDDSEEAVPPPTDTATIVPTATPTPVATATAMPLGTVTQPPDETATVSAAATATPSPAPNELVYLLSGTLNGQPTVGRMRLLPTDPPTPNLLLYDVTSFHFGDLHGTGNLEFFTLSNTYTLELTLRDPEQLELDVAGTAPLASNFPLLPGEFNVSGADQSLIFTVQRPGPRSGASVGPEIGLVR